MVLPKKARSRSDGRLLHAEWIELFSEAVVLVGSGARVIARNREADRLFERSRIVQVVRDRLRVLCNGNQGRVEDLIARAIAARGESCHLRIRQMENGEALGVIARRPGREAQAMLVLSDGCVEIDPGTRSCMRELWNLTDAEARVAAAIVEGADLKTYASETGVSPHTVRSQLASVLAKTGAGRQSDLVRLVLRGPAYLAGGSYNGG